MTSEPEWKKFERAVHSEMENKFPGSTIRHDVRLPGALSGVARQIDIFIEEALPGGDVRTAVDAKQRARPIDVKEVESFIGLLRDTNVDRGIMVSASGYSEGAFTRAFRDDVDLDLDVLTLEELKRWQADGALPYAGRNAVAVSTPFGWVVDGQRVPGCLARLYCRGLTFEQAALNQEFMYVNLWDRRAPVDSIEALLAKQEVDIRGHAPGAVISVREVPVSVGHRGCIRRADIAGYPTAEITGFVEFPDSIFFAVLFTLLVVERRNTRKLEYLLKRVLPLSVRQSAT
jgi:hypothetical protein